MEPLGVWVRDDLRSPHQHQLLRPARVGRPSTSVRPVEGMEPFLFVPFDSFLYAVDILGYSFMSLATLCAARVVTGSGHERLVRWFLVANGFVLPFLLFQMYVHSLIWIAAIWAITFPGSTWSLAILFKRMPVGERALLSSTSA